MVQEGTKRVAPCCDEDHRFWIFDCPAAGIDPATCNIVTAPERVPNGIAKAGQATRFRGAGRTGRRRTRAPRSASSRLPTGGLLQRNTNALHSRLLYARRTSLLASGQVHVIGSLIGTAEVWIALRFMGFPVTVNEALVIESLLQAVRGAAFAIPGAFGAQEAGLILLCGLFEIPPDQAFALSLIKRAADLVVGLPGLVSLQVLEGGRLKALYSHAREGRARNRP
jgi:uncharacterized membrane protein YbhN (UPF0104 family)